MANGKFKKEKQDSELRVVNDGLVKLMKFDYKYNGNTYAKCKGSFALELFGHNCVVCMEFQPNTKHWKNEKGKEPFGFVQFAVCEQGNSTNWK